MPSETETADLIGTAQAAELIGCERSTLSHWIAKGRISVALKLPGRTGSTLFERAEVERVAAEYRSGQAGQPAQAGSVAS